MDQDEQKENRRNHEAKRLSEKHQTNPHKDLRLKLTKAGNGSGDGEICGHDTNCNRDAREDNQQAACPLSRPIRRDPDTERSNRAADDN